MYEDIGTSTCVFIDSTEKKFLLQLRDSHAKKDPNQYGFFGGHREKGESAEECIKRELFEELEYTPKNLQLFRTFLIKDIPRSTFLEEFDFSQPIVQHEGEGRQWFPLDEALQEVHLKKERKERLTKIAIHLKWI